MKVFFKYATVNTLLNSIIKTNLLSDLTNFFSEHALGWNDISKISDYYMFFFKSFFNHMKGVENRKNCQRFMEELDRSSNWKYIQSLIE